MKKSTIKYALGEILIVFIGITLAFSINKCSENGKNRKLKQQYLQSLSNDLENDRQQLEINIKLLETKSGEIKELLQKIDSGGTNQEIVALFFKVSPLNRFNPKDVTYQTLINSADMNLFEDFQLRVAIEEHYSNTYANLKTDYSRVEHIHKTYLADLYIHGLDYSKLPGNEFPFKDKNTLVNILQSMNGAIGINILSSKMGMESCNGLIAKIQKH